MADVLDPPDAGNGPVVLTLAMLLAATFTRKLAADNPDVAIESMLMDLIYRTSHTRSFTPSLRCAALYFDRGNQ